MVPKGKLTTNNKTNVNLDDPDWMVVFQYLNEHYRPNQRQQELSEQSLKEKLRDDIRAITTDRVTDEKSVWPTGTRIDLFRKSESDRITINEVKVGPAQALHLYQLKMYWDGLCLQREFPSEGILLCDSFTTRIEEMLREMNSLPAPEGSNPYNFTLQKIDAMHLRSDY